MLDAARLDLASEHRRAFAAAGSDEVRVQIGADRGTFGDRLRDVLRSVRTTGVVVLGSGAIPLARAAEVERLVAAGRSAARVALTNNRYSADVVAIGDAGSLPAVPGLPTDNALPRWLEEIAGYRVEELRPRWRLGVDLDSPLDLVLLNRPADANVVGVATQRLVAVAERAHDRTAELLVSGRTSSAALSWLERAVPARVRAVVEERGLRASSPLAVGSRSDGHRPPASILGRLLERDGPASLGHHLSGLADAALVDTRVLLADRLGADERAWPSPEDRFASDLLLAGRIIDPWLRELTAAALAAPIPIVLGGHSLVGPGLRLALAVR
jgi:hypothetical protein